MGSPSEGASGVPRVLGACSVPRNGAGGDDTRTSGLRKSGNGEHVRDVDGGEAGVGHQAEHREPLVVGPRALAGKLQGDVLAGVRRQLVIAATTPNAFLSVAIFACP